MYFLAPHALSAFTPLPTEMLGSGVTASITAIFDLLSFKKQKNLKSEI
jgi:hypothetical protein